MFSTVIKKPEFVLYIFDEKRILQSLYELLHGKHVYKAIFLLHLHHHKTFWHSLFITPIYICISRKLFAFEYDSEVY